MNPSIGGSTGSAALAALVVAASWGGTARAQDTVIQPAQAAQERASGAAQQPATPADVPDAEASDVAAAPEPAATAPAAEAQEASGAVTTPVEATAPAPATPATALQPATAEEREPAYGAHAVVTPGPGTLREEHRIGAYRQPRWTGRRRFPTTRIYVVPAGQLGLEYWLEYKQSLKDEDAARYRSQYELEMGLGHRLQLDVYLQTEQEGHIAPFELKAEKLELRWALADWGRIPLNPTLYAEFVRQHDGPPKIELKALLGAELAPRWHWGFNVVWEHELGRDQENESALVTAVSYSLLDEVFSLGAEAKFETVDVKGDRFSFENWELLVGPSIAWAPVPPMHVLLVGLFGNETEGDEHTPLFEPTLVVGWEL